MVAVGFALVLLIMFVYFFLTLVSQRERGFWWNIGFKLRGQGDKKLLMGKKTGFESHIFSHIVNHIVSKGTSFAQTSLKFHVIIFSFVFSSRNVIEVCFGYLYCRPRSTAVVILNI